MRILGFAVRRALIPLAVVTLVPLAAVPVDTPAATAAGGVPVSTIDPSVAIVGDSITAWNLGDMERALHAARVPSWRIDAQAGRQSRGPVLTPTTTIESGIQAIAALKQAGIDPAVWVIQLGTNDAVHIEWCECEYWAFSRQLVAEVLQAIGPGHQVVWVNIRNAQFPWATVAFNDALRERDVVDPALTVVDWFAASEGNPAWMADSVHPSPAGLGHYFSPLAGAVAALLPSLVVPPMPTSVPQPVVPGVTAPAAGSAAAGQPAVRLRTPVPPTGGTTIMTRCGRIPGSVSASSSVPAVRAVECALAQHGLNTGAVDWVYDSSTYAAISVFQLRQSMWDSSGVVTNPTAHALGIDAV